MLLFPSDILHHMHLILLLLYVFAFLLKISPKFDLLHFEYHFVLVLISNTYMIYVLLTDKGNPYLKILLFIYDFIPDGRAICFISIYIFSLNFHI